MPDWPHAQPENFAAASNGARVTSYQHADLYEVMRNLTQMEPHPAPSKERGEAFYLTQIKQIKFFNSYNS